MAVVLKSVPVYDETSLDVGDDGVEELKELTDWQVRTSYVDAWTAHSLVKKVSWCQGHVGLFSMSCWLDATIVHPASQGRARGKRRVLRVRSCLQERCFQLGELVRQHHNKVIFITTLTLVLCCLSLKTMQYEGQLEKLWIDGSSFCLSL